MALLLLSLSASSIIAVEARNGGVVGRGPALAMRRRFSTWVRVPPRKDCHRHRYDSAFVLGRNSGVRDAMSASITRRTRWPSPCLALWNQNGFRSEQCGDFRSWVSVMVFPPNHTPSSSSSSRGGWKPDCTYCHTSTGHHGVLFKQQQNTSSTTRLYGTKSRNNSEGRRSNNDSADPSSSSSPSSRGTTTTTTTTTAADVKIANYLSAWNQITSTKSATVKLIKSLLFKRKKRSEHNLTIMEGHRIIIDTLSNTRTRHFVRHVIASPEALHHVELGNALRDVLIRVSIDNDDGGDDDDDNDGCDDGDDDDHDDESTSNNRNKNAKIKVSIGTDEVLKASSDTVTPQGVVAIVSIPEPFEPGRRSSSGSSSSSSCQPSPEQQQQQQQQQQYTSQSQRSSLSKPKTNKNPMYLILDGLSDPGNVGTLLRSSVAVGVKAVVLLSNCCDVWNPKAIRSAMGSTFCIPIRQVEDWKDCTRFLRTECGVTMARIYAATMIDEVERNGKSSGGGGVDDNGGGGTGVKRKSLPHYEIDWAGSVGTATTAAVAVTGDDDSSGMGGENNDGKDGPWNPVALCIGNEGNGLSDDVRAAVARGEINVVHVPMEHGIESLNVAVCGSVILFEYMRQCRVGR